MKCHSIELPFSRESKARLFEKLSESGLERWSSTEGFKPHLSLSVIREEVENVNALREIVTEVANVFPPSRFTYPQWELSPESAPCSPCSPL